MKILHPRGLWGCTLIAARPGNLYRHAATPVPLASTSTASARLPTPLPGRSAKLIRALHSTKTCLQSQVRFRPRQRPGTCRDWCAASLSRRRLLLLHRGGGCGGRSFKSNSNNQQTRETCLELSGLTCWSCVDKVERKLLSVDGVLEVRNAVAPVSCGGMLSLTLRYWGTLFVLL